MIDETSKGAAGYAGSVSGIKGKFFIYVSFHKTNFHTPLLKILPLPVKG
jgi:hypothetical protein